MIGNVETSEWITVAADIDGEPQPGELGKLRTERYAKFAWLAEAETWLAEQQADGYDGTIASTAVAWFGKTDAPGNCWSVTASKITGTVVRDTASGELHILISALGDSHGRSIAVWADCGTVRIDVSGDDWRELDDAAAARLIAALQDARAEALLQQVIMEAPDA